MEVLEHDAGGIASEPRQLVLVERPEIAPGDGDAARAGALQPGGDHHHGRLAGARRPDDGHGFAGIHREAHAAQHVDGTRRAGQRKVDVVEEKHRSRGHAIFVLSRPRLFALGCDMTLRCQLRWLGNRHMQHGVWRRRPAGDGILVLGDSIAAGFGLPASEALPAKLEAKLRAEGHDVRVINAGVSGDTTAAGLARLDWVLGGKPDFAVVQLGANDMLRGLSPAETRKNLDIILTQLDKASVPTLLVGMKAGRNLGADYAKSFDGVFPDLAKTHNIELYPFLLDGIALDPRFNQGDGIHPNERGVAVLVDRLTPYVVRLLQRSKG